MLNRRIAVTSADSGALLLNEQEMNAGWSDREQGRIYRGLPDGRREDRDDWKVAYRPVIDSIHGIPKKAHDGGAGFNEWYVFERAVPTGEIESFVSWMGFRLYESGLAVACRSLLGADHKDCTGVLYCGRHRPDVRHL
ncbi:MAG: hypothetical protein QOJ99_495 [Bryobacterales bacterium]|nr:hypothetical protein [Bryobacterales bacterium]